MESESLDQKMKLSWYQKNSKENNSKEHNSKEELIISDNNRLWLNKDS